MSKLAEEYGIEEDPRYRICFREAMTSLWLFLFTAAAVIGTIYVLTSGQQASNYTFVFGFPSYLFWGILITHLVFVITAVLMLSLIYQDMSLEPDEPSSHGES